MTMRAKWVPKSIVDEDVADFMGAAAAAKKAGKTTFEFGGKKYKVTMSKDTADEIEEKLEKDSDDPCWKGYVQVGMKKKDGKEVPNCVPKESVNEAVQSDLDKNKPIVVKGVKGTASKKFTKKFKNMAAYDKWMDSEGDDVEIYRVMNEEMLEENTAAMADQKRQKAAELAAKWGVVAKQRMIDKAINAVKKEADLVGDRESAESIAFRIAKEYSNLGFSSKQLASAYRKKFGVKEDVNEDTDTPILVSFHDAVSKRKWLRDQGMKPGDSAILRNDKADLLLKGDQRPYVKKKDWGNLIYQVKDMKESLEVGTPELKANYVGKTPGERSNHEPEGIADHESGNGKDVIEVHGKATEVAVDANKSIAKTFAGYVQGIRQSTAGIKGKA